MAKERRPLNVFTYREGGDNNLQIVPLSRLVAFPYQSRRYFNPVKLEELAGTIKKHGILEPLLVRLAPDGNNYEILGGERRYRAGQIAGVAEARILLLDVSDEEAIEISLLDNLQREDLNPVEEVEGILNLLSFKLDTDREEVTSLLYRLQKERKGKTAHNVVGDREKEIIAGVFDTLGASNFDSFINHRLPLLKLPEDISLALRSGKIEYTKARTIASLKDVERRAELLKEAIEENLSLSQIKERVSSLPTESVRQDNSAVDTAKTLGEFYRKLKRSRLWEKDPKKWRKAKTLIDKLEELLKDEPENTPVDDRNPDTSGLSR